MLCFSAVLLFVQGIKTRRELAEYAQQIQEPYVYAKRAHDRVRQMLLEGKGGC